NQFRPQLVTGGGADCFDNLTQKNVKFSRLGNMSENQCLVKDAVRIEAFPHTKLSGPVILNCRTALATQNWFEKIKAKNVAHLGTYNCRTMRGSGIASEHSFGTAIDIASINGSSVRLHWDEKSERGAYIRKAAQLACDYFTNSITPDHNALHYDHLHLDMGYGTTCLPPIVQRLEKLAISVLEQFL
ncbi:extensin family protein, partial [uncultured Psychrosphaera sp.]|uniref:extensin family protein n=1 Tax=uncultured Psychrosphaera sp. TaxID=1403522 RepID=UPI0030FA2663